MSFLDVRFPETYAYGALASDDWMLEIIETLNRREYRNAPLAHPRRLWDLSTTGKTMEQKDGIRDFFMATMGGLHSFAFRDLSDYQLVQDQIHVGDGSDEIQLVKRYRIGNEEAGYLTYERPITLPIVSTVRIWLDDVEAESGWEVERETGLVTFAAAPGEGVVVSAACEFDVPVRFRESRLSWSAPNRNVSEGLIFWCDSLALIEVLTDVHAGGIGPPDPE